MDLIDEQNIISSRLRFPGNFNPVNISQIISLEFQVETTDPLQISRFPFIFVPLASHNVTQCKGTSLVKLIRHAINSRKHSKWMAP